MTLAHLIAAEMLARADGEAPASAIEREAVENIVARTLLHVDCTRSTLADLGLALPDLTTDLWAHCFCCGSSWPRRADEPWEMTTCCVCADPLELLPTGATP